MRSIKKLRHGDDDGIALIAVMIAIMVISAFLLVTLNYGLQNSTAGRKDQDAKSATAAAQAGLDEYLARLNATPGYYLVGNTDAGNLAFSAGRSIQGTGSAGASYKYQVLTAAADTTTTGIVRLKVTGTSGLAGRTVSRTLTANLRTKGFLNSIYFSDYEVQDPALVGTNAATCSRYYYRGRNSASGCNEIQWTGGDTVRGPLHSNDALQINGPVNFTNTAETSCPSTNVTAPTYVCTPPKSWWGTQGGGTLPTNYPHYAASIPMPDGNTTLATHTTPGTDGNQTGSGCYYTGATKITFTGTTMSVWSPATTSPKTPLSCLNVSNRASLQTGLPIPPVIYVDETTGTCSSVGYPMTGEALGSSNGVNDSYWTSTGSNATTNYRCGRGTAFVSGSADAQVTVATADDIVVTGNLTVADNLATTDVIGLIAANDVWIYHPISSTSANLLPSASAVTSVQAAILSISHSFVVQNWAAGTALGTLNVTGAIAQKFRGPVGTGSGTTISTGYYKNYVYDPRLAYLQPPYFLASGSNQWLVSSVTDD